MVQELFTKSAVGKLYKMRYIKIDNNKIFRKNRFLELRF